MSTSKEIRGTVTISKWNELMKRVRAIKRLVKQHKLKNSWIQVEDISLVLDKSKQPYNYKKYKPRWLKRYEGNPYISEGPFRLTWGYEKS